MLYLLSSLTSAWAAKLFCNANEYSSVFCSKYLEIATYVPWKATDCLDQSFCPQLKHDPLPFPQVSLVPCFSCMYDAALLPDKNWLTFR